MPETVAATRRVLLDYPALIFRGQSLSKDAQATFSPQFGELEGHIWKVSDGSTFPLVHTLTNLEGEGNVINMDVAKLNYFWHTDKSYHAVPPEGGDTQFSNARMAYAALSSVMKARLEGLTTVHDWVASGLNSSTSPATK